MNKHLVSTLVLAIAAASAGLAQAAAPVKMAGGMLVNTSGMTLYTFDNDTAGSGKSACNGPCAGLWLPVMAEADAKPEGDMTGDNFKNVWHVIKP